LRQDVGDGAAVTHAQEVFVRGGGDAKASVRQISVQHGVCKRHGERGEADAIGGARGGGAQVGSERGVERVRQGELNTVCRDGGGREMPQEVRIVNFFFFFNKCIEFDHRLHVEKIDKNTGKTTTINIQKKYIYI